MGRNELLIRIEYDNAAFGETPGREVARILRKLADTYERTGMDAERTLLDVNGNTVGEAVDAGRDHTPKGWERE